MARLYISRGEGRQGIGFVENAMTKFPAAIKPFLLYSIKKKNSALLILPHFQSFISYNFVNTPSLVIFALCSISTWQKKFEVI
jgi:hypothetical protein